MCFPLLKDPHTKTMIVISSDHGYRKHTIYLTGKDIVCKPLDGLEVMVGHCDNGCELHTCSVDAHSIHVTNNNSTSCAYHCKCESDRCDIIVFSAVYMENKNQRSWMLCAVS